MIKICSNCKISKNENNFHKNKYTSDGYCSKCKECCKIYSQKYYTNNIEKISKSNNKYYSENKEKIKNNYNQEKAKEYYLNNKDKLLKYRKEYYENNKKNIFTRQNIYKKKRKENDPEFKLRHNISNMITQALKIQNSNKNGISCFKHLDYTPKDLREHLELLWEDWMSWNNYGSAKIGERRWNIDHIIPQSYLPYNSIKDENFKICWSLDNLRPMEAIANIKKSNFFVKNT